MKSLAYFGLAAICEIAGCFSLWSWLRQHRGPLWLVSGVPCLVAFAFLLTRVESVFTGRVYAAYGRIYIAASLLWLWIAEHSVPDRYDLLGGLLCLGGTAVILFVPRPA